MITPITKDGDLSFKREDLYKPYDDIPVTGSKIRQCRNLLSNNKNWILRKNLIAATACSSVSPQGVILARVCKELKLPCRIYTGGIPDHKKHKFLVLAESLGAEIINATGVAYNNAVDYQIRKDRNNFHIGFGLEGNLDDTIPCIAEQVENVLEYKEISIPVGSGITAAGILSGLMDAQYQGKVRLIQIAGYDRTDKIVQILNVVKEIYLEKKIRSYRVMSNGFEFFFEKFDYPYGKLMRHPFLDGRYEAKAMEHLRRVGYLKNGLFWVIGKIDNSVAV